MADELEEAGVAHRALLGLLASAPERHRRLRPRRPVWRFRGAAEATIAAFREPERRARRGRARRAGAVRRPGRPRRRGDRRIGRRRRSDGRGRGGGRPALALPQRAGPGPGRRAGDGETCSRPARSGPSGSAIAAAGGWREGRLVGAALEERNVPFRFAGDAAFFQRPEVRDALAWLRMLADPNDSAAVVRALTRPPVDLRSVDLARVTTIARRRKLDMVSALDAALESPQLPPEARDRIHAFLRLYPAASAALEELRADVFVRRLIERIGLRRHRLFAASPETAERLVNLSRLAEMAAAWARREPRGATRDFIRHLTAVADAGDARRRRRRAARARRRDPGRARAGQGARVRPRLPARPAPRRLRGSPGRGRLGPGRAGRRRAAAGGRGADRPAPVAARLHRDDPGPPGAGPLLAGDDRAIRRPAFAAASRPSARRSGARRSTRRSCSARRRACTPPTGWSATRCSRPPGGPESAISEMRLDTAEDVNRAVARFLELVKLAALVQRPGPEPTARGAGGDQRAARPGRDTRAAGGARGLGARRVRARRGGASGRRGSGRRRAARALARPVHPAQGRRARALGLRHRPLPDLPAEVQVRPRLRDPAGADDQPALRDPDPPGARPLPLRGDAGGRAESGDAATSRGASTGCSACSRAAGGARASAPPTTSFSTATARWRRSPATTSATCARSRARSGWSAGFNFRIGPHQLRGRVDRVDRTRRAATS